jgi:hypothetical protein
MELSKVETHVTDIYNERIPSLFKKILCFCLFIKLSFEGQSKTRTQKTKKKYLSEFKTKVLSLP